MPILPWKPFLLAVYIIHAFLNRKSDHCSAEQADMTQYPRALHVQRARWTTSRDHVPFACILADSGDFWLQTRERILKIGEILPFLSLAARWPRWRAQGSAVGLRTTVEGGLELPLPIQINIIESRNEGTKPSHICLILIPSKIIITTQILFENEYILFCSHLKFMAVSMLKTCIFSHDSGSTNFSSTYISTTNTTNIVLKFNLENLTA